MASGGNSSASTITAKKRYILFVGSLPFRATEEDIKTFLAPANAINIRLNRDKQTKKSKGFAFVEFDNKDDLEVALGKHQQKLFTRKVNVELTAGGGGSKSEHRKAKIKANNERYRQEVKERKLAEESEKKE